MKGYLSCLIVDSIFSGSQVTFVIIENKIDILFISAGGFLWTPEEGPEEISVMSYSRFDFQWQSSNICDDWGRKLYHFPLLPCLVQKS